MFVRPIIYLCLKGDACVWVSNIWTLLRVSRRTHCAPLQEIKYPLFCCWYHRSSSLLLCWWLYIMSLCIIGVDVNDTSSIGGFFKLRVLTCCVWCHTVSVVCGPGTIIRRAAQQTPCNSTRLPWWWNTCGPLQVPILGCSANLMLCPMLT